MKRFLLILGILVVVLTGTVLALPFLIDVNRFRPMIESELSTSLGREVHLGELSLKPFQGIVSAADLSIADHPGYSRSAFLKAKALTVDIEVWPLLTQRTLNTSGITIVQPEVNLIQSEAGVWNYASLGSHSSDTPKASKNVEKGAAAGMAFLIQSIKLTNGKLTIAHLGSKSRPLVFDKANITITNFSPTSKFPFSLAATFPGGGEIKATGEAGPVPTHDASETPLNLDVHLTHTDLSASGLMAEGSGIDGLASIDADFKSNGKVADLSGKVRVEHLLLAKGGTASTKPVELDYSVQHNLKTQTGRIVRGDIHIGTATAKLIGTYDVRNEPGSIKLNLTGPALAISELSPMLPAMGVTLPKGATIENGSALADVAFEGPLNALRIDGTTGLDGTRIANYDLGSKLKILEALAGIKGSPATDIQKFRTSFKSSPDGTTAEDIVLIVPSIGTLTGTGQISADRKLSFRMNAALPVGNFPFFIDGTLEDPKYHVDVKGIAKDQLKNAIKNDPTKAVSGLLNRFLKRQ